MALNLRQTHIDLARNLPRRLLDFFRKHPTPALLQAVHPDPQKRTDDKFGAELQEQFRNPFQPSKNFSTGRWRGPTYGLRRQADLVKLARENGVESLLPYSIKLTGERQRRREERGLRVKGTGVGQKVKGKTWERTLKSKLETRKQAMLKMPEMIQTWKQRGHGRGWSKWPK